MEHLGKAEQIIVGYNDTRHAINANVREFLGYDSPYPVKGDKLIMLRNNKDHNVFNGLCGVATDNYYDYDSKSESFMVDVELETGFKKTLPLLTTYFQHPGNAEALNVIPGWIKKKMIHADYGYAISCNKSQGSSYRSGLIVNEPFGRTPEDRRRWEYTAITRFSESAVIAIRN